MNNKVIHVLLPTDFSAESEIAINVVKQLMGHTEINISMLYIMSPNAVSLHGAEGTFMDSGAIPPAYLKELREQALNQIKLQAEENGLKTVNQDVIIDTVSTGIVEYAQEKDIDLIVMGTKQAKGLLAWLSGSDAQVVARISTIPLLTVMGKSEIKKIDKILLLHDCKKHPLVAPHPLIMRFQDIYDAHIHLLYVDTEETIKDMGTLVEKYIDTHKLKDISYQVIHGGDIKEIIPEFQDKEFDLLCMGTHGRNPIMQLFKKSFTEYMIGRSHTPILSYRIN